MKKRGKRLLALCGVLILCIGGYVLVRQVIPAVEVESEAATASIKIETMDSDAVYTMDWEYQGEIIKLERTSDGWQYAKDAAFPLEQSYAQTMLLKATTVSASQRVDDVEDLSEYGLDSPMMEIVLTDYDNNKVQYALGDQSTLTGEYYMMVGDDTSTVWVVPENLYSAFAHTLYSMIAMEDIPVMSDVQALHIARDTGDLDIVYIEDNEGLTYTTVFHWFVQDGDTYQPADNGKVSDLYSLITDMSWVTCVDYSASEEALASYGLAEPAAEVTLHYNATETREADEQDENGSPVTETETVAKTFTLEIGDYTGNSACYARLPGSSMVYLIDATIADTFLLANYDSVKPDDILPVDWETVTSFEVTLNGETHSVQYLGTEESEDEDGNTTMTYRYTEGETELDGSAVRAMLSKVSGLYAYGSTAGAQGRGEVISFVFHRSEEPYPEISLAFHQYDSSSYLVEWNGVMTGQQVSKSSVDSVCTAVAVLFEATAASEE